MSARSYAADTELQFCKPNPIHHFLCQRPCLRARSERHPPISHHVSLYRHPIAADGWSVCGYATGKPMIASLQASHIRGTRQINVASHESRKRPTRLLGLRKLLVRCSTYKPETIASLQSVGERHPSIADGMGFDIRVSVNDILNQNGAPLALGDFSCIPVIPGMATFIQLANAYRPVQQVTI